MQAVFQQVAGHCIAESVEEIRADADERQDDPRLVAEQVRERLEGELLRPDGLQALLRQEAAGQRAQRGQCTENHAQDSVLMRRGATHHLLQVREGKQGDKAHRIGTDHPVGRELVLLVVIGGHHAQQRAVGHVHGGIDGHHQQVQRVRVNPLAHGAEIGRIQQQGENNAQRNGAEDEPGTVGAPLGLRPVGERAHHRVGDHVEQAGDQHQGGGIGNRQAEDVRKEQGERNGHDFPGDATGGGVTQGISDFFGEFGHRFQCCFLQRYTIFRDSCR